MRFGPITTTFTDYVPSDDCRPGISATVTGTDVVVGQIVQTLPPSSGSIFGGRTPPRSRSSSPTAPTASARHRSGSWASRSSLDPESSDEGLSRHLYGESLTIYDVSGQVIGTETFRSIEHYIIEDLPPVGPSDNDVVGMASTAGASSATCKPQHGPMPTFLPTARSSPVHPRRRLPVRHHRCRPGIPLGHALVLVGALRLRRGGPHPHPNRVEGRATRTPLCARLHPLTARARPGRAGSAGRPRSRTEGETLPAPSRTEAPPASSVDRPL